MAAVLQALGLGKDSHSDPSADDKTPAEQIKEKAIEEERTEVADGSNANGDAHGNPATTTANGITTNPEEAHASDIKDKMSSNTDSTATTTTTTQNGADDNASMLPLGKGGYSEAPMGSNNTDNKNTTVDATSTGNATPATNTGEDSASVNYSNSNREAPSASVLEFAAVTSVTRAEINSAKQAIIHAVANCKLTREVVFSDTDEGTEDGSAEVKRVLSGYKGIDQALAEMNRYIPVHVRDKHDLGVGEGERIQKEQHEAAKALDPTKNSTTSGTVSANPDEKITEKEALAEAPAATSTGAEQSGTSAETGLNDLQKEELSRVPDANADAATANDSKIASEGIPLQDMEPEAEHGITLGAGVIHGSTSQHEDTADTATSTAAAVAPVPVSTSSTSDNDVKPSTAADDRELTEANDKSELTNSTTAVAPIVAAEEAVTGSNNADSDDAGLASSTAADKGKGRAVGETAEDQPLSATTPPKSPIQGEKLSERLKREVEERARRGQLGVFNKPLGSNASQANLSSSAAKAPESTSASADTTANKDAPASSAFTEEFGPGETGLSPSSPTTTGTTGATAVSTKPPSTRARTASLSSQTSTGEKRGLLGLFRRRSKRQSISDASTGRKASQDLSRSVSKDTISHPVATSAAVPPAADKPVETVDTTATTIAAEDQDTSKDTGLATVAVGSGTAATGADEPATAKDEPDVADKSTTTAEPSTSEHKVEDVAPASEKSTQTTTHEPAPAIGTAAEPVVYAEETAPATSTEADESTTAVPHKEDPNDMLGPGAVAALESSHEEKEEPQHIESHDHQDMTGPGALAAALGEKATADSGTQGQNTTVSTDTAAHTSPIGDEASVVKTPATADKSTSTSAEKGTSTEDDQPALAPAVIAAPAVAAPTTTSNDDTPLYTKQSDDKSAAQAPERRNSKGGFFGLFRRRSSRRSSSGPPQRAVSDTSKPAPVETVTTPVTEHHVTPIVVEETVVAKEDEHETAVKDEPLEHGESPFIHATDPEDTESDAAKAGLVRSDTDKEIAREAEAYSEATIHAYGALNIDELETVEEEMERGPEETVAEPDGSFVDHQDDHDDHEADEERETVQSDHDDGVVSTTGERHLHGGDHAVESTEGAVPAGHDSTSERVVSPVVAATPAERLLQSGSGERRKSRGSGFFGLFRSRTRKDKDQPPETSPYASIVKNMGVVEQPTESRDVGNKGPAVAVGTGFDDYESTRSPRPRTVEGSIVDHGAAHEEDALTHAEEEEVYVEVEEEIPDNRSITEIAASIPLPAPVYTDKTRAKHERLRKKREHEEAVERERIRKETELLNKRERILNAYTGKQDFTKVPKPSRTKNFGRAHERKDLDGVQYVNKSDKKAARKSEELTRSASRGSSIDEPSSPTHPASGGFVGSIPVNTTHSRVSHNTHGTSGPDTEPGSPSSPVSPVLKLARRVSAIRHNREKSVEPVAA